MKDGTAKSFNVGERLCVAVAGVLDMWRDGGNRQGRSDRIVLFFPCLCITIHIHNNMCLCVFVSLRVCAQSLMNRPPVTPLFCAHSSSTSINLQPMPHARDQNNNKRNHVPSLHSLSLFHHIRIICTVPH